mmetsp:Transcript_26165/g.4490  ORF Transcript_26165/g.4490 Transcript_26165/m.4490 type:complete len:94 (+) Transcript_26165:921-1202(+)
MTCKATGYEEVKTCRGLSCKCAATFKINEYTQECVSDTTCTGATFLGLNNECQDCYKNCATCKGPNEDDCLTCKANTSITPYNTCECAPGTPN